jgi:hypothetical protein
MDSFSRRALISVLAVTAIAVPVAGCGGDSESGDSGKNPLDNALGYVPENSPFVAAIETDPNSAQFKNAAAIAKKFPFANQLQSQLEQSLGQGDTNYERDIKPLLGNEFVVGATNVETFTNSESSENEAFIAAIQVKDGKKLTEAIEKQKPKELGEKDGAKIYDSDDSFAAVKDDVLIVANSRRELEAGLTRRGKDERFDEEKFDEGTEGLPKDAALRTYFNLQELIARDPDTKDAQKVKWVKALRSFGLTASAGKDNLAFQFNMGTDPDGLSDADLPLAAGDESPEVAERAGEFGLGLRGIDQIVNFSENAAQAVDPSEFGSYETAKSTIEKQLKLDLEKDVLEQLSGDITASASPSGSSLGLKAEVKDPDAFKDTLAAVTKVLPAVLKSSSGGGRVVIRKSGDLYAASTSSGGVVYGLVDDEFVLSNTAAGARAIAAAPTTNVPGAEGAFAMKADAGQLVTRAIAQFGSQLGGGALGAQLFAGPLGDLTGSVKANTDGVGGKVSLSFK